MDLRCRGKNNHPVFEDAFFLHRIENLTNSVIKLRQHGSENAPLDVIDMRKLLHVFVVSLQRAVDGVVSEIEKKRALVFRLPSGHDDMATFRCQAIK